MKYLLLIVCFVLTTGFSQAFAEISGDSLKPKKITVTPFPALFSTPETGFGYGALAVIVYNSLKDTLARSSNLQLLSYYTQRKQFSLQASFLAFTKHEKYVFSGENNYYDFTIYYFGVGNATTKADQSLIDYKYITLQNRGLKRIKGHFFGGLQFQVNQVWDVEFDRLTSKLAERPETELGTSTVSGVGPALLYDKRDNTLNASSGLYIDLGAHFNHKVFGSNFNFTRFSADLRKFIPLHAKHVLAFQGRGVFNSGDAPFREMANLGGKYIMRGFYEGRFRDKHMAAVQGEYRWQPFKRIGFVAFGSAGRVAGHLKEFAIKDAKTSGGGGIRLMINRRERLNVRIDYAVTSDKSTGLYFALGESF